MTPQEYYALITGALRDAISNPQLHWGHRDGVREAAYAIAAALAKIDPAFKTERFLLDACAL